MRTPACSVLLPLLSLLAGCGGEAVVDKAATCAATFGQGLTNGFGRADGTVLAVIEPNDQRCAQPNSTHLVLQLTMNGAAYRMVVDVLSNQGSPDVWFTELDAPLAGGPWAEGWHVGQTLDYATNLGWHSPAFVEMQQAPLVTKISSELELGAKVSVFATSEDRPDSAHDVHRHAEGHDGAIVIGPDSPSPHWMLLRFDEDVF